MSKTMVNRIGTRCDPQPDVVSVQVIGAAVGSPPAAVRIPLIIAHKAARLVGASFTPQSTVTQQAVNTSSLLIRKGTTSMVNAALTNAAAAWTALTEYAWTMSSTYANTAVADGDVVELYFSAGTDLSSTYFTVTLTFQPD